MAGFRSNNGIHCCKDCTDRQIGCHSTCEKYIQSKEEHEEKRAFLREQKQKQTSYISYVAEVKQRMKAKKGKKS